MHPVHDRVGARAEIARPLDRPGERVKEPFPPLGHRELTMVAIAMQKKALEEDRELPMNREEDEDCHDLSNTTALWRRPPRLRHPARALSWFSHKMSAHVRSFARQPGGEGCSKAAVGEPVRGPRQRRDEAARLLVLAPGPGLEDIEPAFQAEADALVVADREMQKRDVHLRPPVAPVQAGLRHDVERTAHDFTARPAAGNHPCETMA